MSTNKMWGGRFESGPAAIMREITPSIDFDKRLAGEDLAGSRAHCRMLASEGIISKDDALAILDGLTQIEKEVAEGSFVFKRELEDIHLNIEARLAEFCAELGLDGQAEQVLFRQFDMVTVQRKLKDAGRFVFIERKNKNPSFLKFVEPTIEKARASLERLQDDPELRPLAALLDRVCPPSP